MYKFIKVKRFNTVGNWCFVPRSEKDIIDHWEKYVKSVINEGMTELTEDAHRKFYRHTTNQYYCMLQLLSRVTGDEHVSLNVIEKGNKELSKILVDLLLTFNKYHKTLLYNNMLETFLPDDDEIVEEKE